MNDRKTQLGHHVQYVHILTNTEISSEVADKLVLNFHIDIKELDSPGTCN